MTHDTPKIELRLVAKAASTLLLLACAIGLITKSVRSQPGPPSAPELPELGSLPDTPVTSFLCSDWVCRSVDHCDLGFSRCSQGKCKCWVSCNSTFDCDSARETCVEGVCLWNTGEHCSTDRDCLTYGFPSIHSGCSGGTCRCAGGAECVGPRCNGDDDCASGQSCDGGSCVAIPPPEPECRTTADCDDGDPCSGRESCSSQHCQANAPPCGLFVGCTKTSATTYECDYPPHLVDSDRARMVLAPRLRRPQILPRPIALRGGGKSAPPDIARFNPASSDVEVALADADGRVLLFAKLADAKQGKAASGWSGDAKSGFTFTDTRSGAAVKAFALHPEPGGGYSFTLDSALSDARSLESTKTSSLLIRIRPKNAQAPTVVRTTFGQCATAGSDLVCNFEKRAK